MESKYLILSLLFAQTVVITTHYIFLGFRIANLERYEKLSLETDKLFYKFLEHQAKINELVTKCLASPDYEKTSRPKSPLQS